MSILQFVCCSRNNQADYLNVTDHRLHQLIQHTESDATLQALKSIVLKGGPDEKEYCEGILVLQRRDQHTKWYLVQRSKGHSAKVTKSRDVIAHTLKPHRRSLENGNLSAKGCTTFLSCGYRRNSYQRNHADLQVAEKPDSQYPVDKPDTPGIPRTHSHVGSEECTEVIPQTSTNDSPEQAGLDSSQVQSMPVSGGKSLVTSERAKRLFAQPEPVFTRSGRHSQQPERLNL
ncbi:Hypothetical predicted protein [Pelobates cultripes]|uniref:Uncharacterized protein n=1 Tax=Pelobates cultripes TaxID=61616 RepID=A0AAD1WBW9_PELCU|nr:Hypothetical predicted protein [Pelobates cultripes]